MRENLVFAESMTEIVRREKADKTNKEIEIAFKNKRRELLKQGGRWRNWNEKLLHSRRLR